MKKLILCIYGIFCAQTLWAATQPHAYLEPNQSTVLLGSTSYFGDSLGDARFTLRIGSEGEWLLTHLDLDAEYHWDWLNPSNTGRRYWGLEASQAYLGTSAGAVEGFQISLGRRHYPWSQLDRNWTMGIWEPRYRNDFLRPESVGLTGVFLEAQRSVVKFTGFASPLFIPERGIPMTLQDGVFEGKEPWVRPPASRVMVLGEATPVRYDLVMPPAAQVILHPSAGIRAQYGDMTQGFWASGSYAYQPMNQILTSYEGYLDMSQDPQLAVAMIYPQVGYHHLVAADVGYESQQWQGGFSVLGEQPMVDPTPEEWTSPGMSDALSVSPNLSVAPFGRRGGTDLSSSVLGLSYLKQWGGDGDDRGKYAIPENRTFEARYLFKNSVKIAVDAPLLRTLTSKTSYLYDFSMQGTLISQELRFAPADAWQILLGADLLGSSDRKLKSSEADFFSRYRSHDRVFGGLSYVF